MPPDVIVLNGINGATGDYFTPPLTVDEAADVARRDRPNPAHRADIQRRNLAGAPHYGTPFWIDPLDLAKAGWGIVFAASDPQAADIRKKLKPLLDFRREQAGSHYFEFIEAEGYRQGEGKQAFLARHGAGPADHADPKKGIPYYLLLAGDPSSEGIPFDVQFELDVEYAVGRLHFDDLEDYARYADAVVSHERGGPARQGCAAFFSPAHPGDPATTLSAEHLVQPLAACMERETDWEVERALGADAMKARLGQLLGPGGPAFVFTASHGMGFPSGYRDDRRDPPRDQVQLQGALLCQDWPGPLAWTAGTPIPPAHYYAADDVLPDADLRGLIVFSFACFGAGTPRHDAFLRKPGSPPRDLTPRDFIAHLPSRLLSQGALAFIGHVERAWSCSFRWEGATHASAFEETIRGILAGRRVGHATEPIHQRYAALAVDFTSARDDDENFGTVESSRLAGLWTAQTDARHYMLLGDPAVRLTPNA